MRQTITLLRKVLWLNAVFICLIWGSLKAQIRLGSSSNEPVNPAASLEVKSGPYPDNTFRGLLLPKVELTNSTTWTLAGSATDGMVIFNTATTTGDYAVTPGIYCWYNFQWNRQSPPIGAAVIASVSCLSNSPATGSYYTKTPLTANNTKQITITPGSAGPYTATARGVVYSFSASGTFTSAQVGVPQTITLLGSGTPQIAGVNTLTLTVGNQSCTFTVDVINYADCSGPLSGVYKVNQELDASNTKQVTIVPPVAGNYSLLAQIYRTQLGVQLLFNKNVVITEAQVGIPQIITLVGSGSSRAAGMYTGQLQISSDGGSNFVVGCSFDVTIDP